MNNIEEYEYEEERLWALFFDEIGVEYIYRPATFRIDSSFNEVFALAEFINKKDGKIYITPSFYLPKIYFFGPDEQAGIFLDINIHCDSLGEFGHVSETRKAICRKAPIPIHSACKLPYTLDKYEMKRNELIDDWYVFISYCDTYVIATPEHHMLKQDCAYGSERMEIPFAAIENAKRRSDVMEKYLESSNALPS